MIRQTPAAAVAIVLLLAPGRACADTAIVHLDEWIDGHCTVCGGSYACADQNGIQHGTFGYTATFTDPLPEGALLWEIDVVVYGINCAGSGAFEFGFNGMPLASGMDPNPSNCSCGTCDPPTTYEGTYHPNGMPGYVYGGLIASLLDCHGTGGAAAAALRREGKEIGDGEAPRFVTASLQVDFLKPTPLGPELEVRGKIVEITDRKVVLEETLSANGVMTAKGRVVAVRMPEGMIG